MSEPRRSERPPPVRIGTKKKKSQTRSHSQTQSRSISLNNVGTSLNNIVPSHKPQRPPPVRYGRRTQNNVSHTQKLKNRELLRRVAQRKQNKEISNSIAKRRENSALYALSKIAVNEYLPFKERVRRRHEEEKEKEMEEKKKREEAIRNRTKEYVSPVSYLQHYRQFQNSENTNTNLIKELQKRIPKENKREDRNMVNMYTRYVTNKPFS